MNVLRHRCVPGLLLAVMCLLPHDGPSQVPTQDMNNPILVEIRAAAEKGDPDAQTRLGHEFRIRNDISNAIKWYTLAATQGAPKAQYELGILLIGPNPMDAFRWIQKSAEQGYVSAQVSLAGYYRDGRMVRRNPVEAYVWFACAAAQGHEKAALERDSLILKMSGAELAQGQHRLGIVTSGKWVLGTNAITTATTKAKVKADLSHLSLKGLTISKSRRSAIINDQTFEPGDELQVKSGTRKDLVRCLEIRPNSVLVVVDGTPGSHELFLR